MYGPPTRAFGVDVACDCPSVRVRCLHPHAAVHPFLLLSFSVLIDFASSSLLSVVPSTRTLRGHSYDVSSVRSHDPKRGHGIYAAARALPTPLPPHAPCQRSLPVLLPIATTSPSHPPTDLAVLVQPFVMSLDLFVGVLRMSDHGFYIVPWCAVSLCRCAARTGRRVDALLSLFTVPPPSLSSIFPLSFLSRFSCLCFS